MGVIYLSRIKYNFNTPALQLKEAHPLPKVSLFERRRDLVQGTAKGLSIISLFDFPVILPHPCQ